MLRPAMMRKMRDSMCLTLTLTGIRITRKMVKVRMVTIMRRMNEEDNDLPATIRMRPTRSTREPMIPVARQQRFVCREEQHPVHHHDGLELVVINHQDHRVHHQIIMMISMIDQLTCGHSCKCSEMVAGKGEIWGPVKCSFKL